MMRAAPPAKPSFILPDPQQAAHQLLQQLHLRLLLLGRRPRGHADLLLGRLSRGAGRRRAARRGPRRAGHRRRSRHREDGYGTARGRLLLLSLRLLLLSRPLCGRLLLRHQMATL